MYDTLVDFVIIEAAAHMKNRNRFESDTPNGTDSSPTVPMVENSSNFSALAGSDVSGRPFEIN